MVFESVLTQVLNRFLGAYVENLDTNQLRVGIWGGDVELKDLVLKQSALDDLDLPIQTIYGRIGKLVLKIPWKNLYGAAIVINIEDIYLLAAPNQQVVYNEEKEDIKKSEAKKREILKVELAKKQEADKDKPKPDNTFVEKLITQVIKNIQLNIKNIHIRYEDKVTSPAPFALGITLSDLHVVSTDENWKPAITKEDITKIFKIVTLDGLAVYWNSNTACYDRLPKVDLLHKMCTEIASKNNTPINYTYVLGPINASARLRINQRPELDKPAFSIPKIHLNLDMERLFVGITKAQYRDIIALGDSMDRMMKGIPYRKFRPNVSSYKNHYKMWWHFAYNCVLESEVRRKRRNWDWNHICKHRDLCREYGILYEKKLQNNATNDELSRIEECEKVIDVFNIVIIRQRVEFENERRVKSKGPDKGWFGWMWGSKTSIDMDNLQSESGIEIRKQFQNAMTKDEKERLYKAIGYQENALPSEFPEAYVDNSCTFILRTLEVELSDDTGNVTRVVFTELKGVKCRVDTRAAANALKVHVKIDEFQTFGLQQDDFLPKIITSETGKDDSGLLQVLFETNPLDKKCGQRLHVTSQPLKIIYDAETVLKAIEIFKVPSSSALDQISAAADSGLSNMKEMTSSGLQHAIDTHVHLDLKVDFRAPYIIIPYGGKYTENENVLVVNLGNFKMHSLDRPPRRDVRQMYAEGCDEKEILKQLMAQSYDQFALELTRVQILIAQSDEDWKIHVNEVKTSDMHILEPINLKVNLATCMITDDPKLPHMKISGELPSIIVNVSDARLLLLMALGNSIPLPKSEVSEPTPLAKVEKRDSSMMLKYLEMQEKASKTRDLLPSKAKKNDGQLVQFTTLEMHFAMSELLLNVKHQTDISSSITNIACFSVKSLELGLIQQTYNTKITLDLGGIGLVQTLNDTQIKMISSPTFEEGEQYLFQIKITQVNKNSPEFHSTYKSCETSLVLEFAKLGIILHKEGLLGLIQFATNLQTEIDDIWGSRPLERVGSTHTPTFKSQLSTISEGLGTQLVSQERKKKHKETNIVVETIKFKLSSTLQEVNVEFATEYERISFWALKGVHANIIVKEPYTQINANLNQIVVVDLNPKTIHNLILTVEGTEALAARIVLYNHDKMAESEKSDISVDLTMGGLRIIFLNWFVTRMLDFLNEFQMAQAAIIEASQAAAKSAKENMQNAYEKATKLSLNINVKAPDIIIPENSKSYDAVLLDLGHISISNQFLTLDIRNEQNFSAVIDEMKLSLTDMKMSRIKLTTSDEIDKELTLLVPLTFKLTIKRNLSTSWYKAVPDIDITGRIFSITILLSQLDYKTLMSVLNGNLSEGQKKLPPKQPLKETIEGTKKASDDKTSITVHEKLSHYEGEKETKINTFLRLTFTMDNLVITLFTGGSKALSIDSPAHDERHALGRFSLEGISVKVRMLTDGSMIASFLLLNCLLDDMRLGREGKLNRLIQRSHQFGEAQSVSSVSLSETAASKSMIDIVVQMKDKDIFTDVRVYSFTLILSMDFLMKIADFLTVPQEEVKEPPKFSKSNTSTKSSISAGMTEMEEKASQITLNLKIEKSDIVLVEHMDSIDTQAMFLNSEVVMKLRMSGEHQVINGSIKDLQLFTCNYNQLKRIDTKSNVLHPVTISLAGSTPENKGLHLELLVTDIQLCVSPATIELLSRVTATATGSSTERTSDDEELQDHSDAWDHKVFEVEDYWFFRNDEAVEATETLSLVSTTPPKPPSKTQEMCIISMPSIILTIEAGVGSKTFPMLVLESSLKGHVNNWSSQMSVEASLTLQMNYYNSRLALWEPLIEPVEVTNSNKPKWVPWELKLEVSKNEPEEVTTPTDFESLEGAPQQAMMCIDVSSDHSIEIVVTKTCLEVLNNLGKAFATAMKPGEVKMLETMAAFKIVNELGSSVSVNLKRGSFALFGGEEPEEVILESGAEAQLQKKTMVLSSPSRLGLQLTTEALTVKDYFVNVKVIDKNCNIDLPVVRADKRFFPLNYRGEGNDHWGLISDVAVDEGVTIITLRSILKVYNHFNIPIEVYYMTVRGNELESITTIQPDSHVNIPLKAVYTPTNELFFSVDSYSVTTTPYVWKDLQTNLTVTKTLHCQPKEVELRNEPFIIQAVGEMEQVYFENTSKHTMSSTCYNIHLRPAVVFKNCLPIDIICCIENTVSEVPVEPGKTLLLPNVEPGKSALVIRLPSYLEKEWSSRQELHRDPNEFSVWNFTSYDSAVQMTLALGMHVVIDKGSVVMALYCPFWMLNKTGLMLAYRNSEDCLNVLHHPANFKGPILFSFNAKNFFGKKKAAVRVEQGDWSDKFSLDVAGSSGVVVCKYQNMLYQIGVQNQLTYNGLTKQVTFTPYYVIINNASFTIEFQENDRPADPWICVEPKSCSALWPKSELDDKLLKLRVKGTEEVSAAFLYTESHTSLLKLKNKYGGINVDIQISEGAIYINLAPYDGHSAPALIINHTIDTMNFWEKESVQIRKLPSKHCMLYTWENPSGPRILVWEGANKKEHSNDLRKDDMGEYTIREGYHIYWVSFLDGMQRILLFTQDQYVAQNARAANLFEQFQQEILVSIHGVGLSLVNNVTRQELMYMAIASSGIIWEHCKMTGRRFKPFGNKQSLLLETAYQRFLLDMQEGHSPKVAIDAKTEVDFKMNVMTKPNKRRIRRTFQTGLWIQMRTSPSQLQIHAKINRLQLDNQMYDCIFPVVLAPVPLPKSVAIDSGMKPFAELSIVQLLMKNTQVKQFKYFKLLIQEFHIKVDLGFVNALVDMLQSAEYSDTEEQQLFLKDMSLVDEPLYSHVSTQSLQEQKSFYDLLHFSPLKIHLSFSMAAGNSAGQSSSTPNFLNVLLQGLGVTLTDLQDVVFRLAYFEREYTFLTQKQLMSEATSHYVGQSVKQLYVLVLGLDVLGNPYGLVRGITQGVEDLFYEPFQGAIQGPGEFAEGLVLGVRSLFGHTVGGAAGAVSRITGAMGKGIAALTFDEDYQRKRRDQINKRPATVQEGIARSGKGLVMGVVDGVTGVFTKPISGAKEEGVGGFFKGLGKGAMGLIARPTAGVVDFASGSLDAVKRVTEVGEDANRLRPPRFLQGDGLVRPYNKYEAQGHKLLTDLEKGKYATTDIYDSHYVIVENRDILLLTDKRLAFISHNDIFGGWQVEWSYTWQEIRNPPSVVPKGVAIPTSDKKKKLGLLGHSDNGKIILIGDPQKKEEICAKIESLRSHT
ncbi:vacuolar protein sorting-associated protein 13 isoform X2 [Tribolium madens]|uniref:vacuolar protein sorting-associated protein 13 isoform X2 n=1 Tax=Tribolium madens TaxID=41895 RepID=UPI001CF72EBB|nr:vacuolar protein sorting-associated protein 13 isoform X2 [Tribolium madens]